MATPFVAVDYSSLSFEPVAGGDPHELDEIDHMVLQFCARFLEVAERMYRRRSYKPPTKKTLKRKPYYTSLYNMMSALHQRGISIDAYVRYLYEEWKFRRKKPLPKSVVDKFGTRLEGIECPSFAWAARKDVQQKFLKAADAWEKPTTLSYESGEVIRQASIQSGHNAIMRLMEATGRSMKDLLLDLYVLSSLPLSYVEHALQQVREEFEATYGISVAQYISSRLREVADAV